LLRDKAAVPFILKAGQSARPKTVTGEVMTHYLVAIYHPDDYDPSVAEDEAMSRIDTLNDEMKAAGVRIFVGGLHPASSARSLWAQHDGEVLIPTGRTWRPRSTRATCNLGMCEALAKGPASRTTLDENGPTLFENSPNTSALDHINENG
jgi:hypothetical protein